MHSLVFCEDLLMNVLGIKLLCDNYKNTNALLDCFWLGNDV